jgi:hypothetical protein
MQPPTLPPNQIQIRVPNPYRGKKGGVDNSWRTQSHGLFGGRFQYATSTAWFLFPDRFGLGWYDPNWTRIYRYPIFASEDFQSLVNASQPIHLFNSAFQRTWRNNRGDWYDDNWPVAFDLWFGHQ